MMMRLKRKTIQLLLSSRNYHTIGVDFRVFFFEEGVSREKMPPPPAGQLSTEGKFLNSNRKLPSRERRTKSNYDCIRFIALEEMKALNK